MSDNLSQAHSKYIVLFVVILMSNWQNGSVVIDVTRFRRANKSCTSIHDSSLCLRALLYSPVINSSFLLRRRFSVFCSFHTLCCYFFSLALFCFPPKQDNISTTTSTFSACMSQYQCSKSYNSSVWKNKV